MKRLLFAFLAATAMVFSLSPSVSAAGVVFGDNDICGSKGREARTCQVAPANAVNSVLVKAVDLAAVIAGVVATIFVIVGGFLYITSAGDPAKAEKARSTIIYALVGLLVAAVARGIVVFVLGRINL
jgi:hypothetical protein